MGVSSPNRFPLPVKQSFDLWRWVSLHPIALLCLFFDISFQLMTKVMTMYSKTLYIYPKWKLKMNNLHKDYLLMKALNYKYSSLKPFGDVLDLLDKTGQEMPIPIKNVCAKVPETLANELEEVCNLLSMSKREFIEMAIIMMIEEVNTLSIEHDIHCDNRSFTPVSDDSEKQKDLPL